jgi:uncharacterized protein (TIGR03118 family)
MRLQGTLQATLIAAFAFPTAAFCNAYTQINLASDILGMAPNLDSNLHNPWGISFNGTSPIWVSDQGVGVSTLYNGAGTPQSLVVTVPGSGATPPQGPTGQVFNSTSASNSFDLMNGSKSLFIFSTLSGTIDAWNGGLGTTAEIAVTATDHAVYTGLALGNNTSGDVLYAADFANGKIDVFSSSFAKTTTSGGFVDPNLPAGYMPYNIQNINGSLYVEYAMVGAGGRASTAPNQGIVDVFDANGNLVERLATNSHLDSPWGVTLAPASFGDFGGDILVGNFGDGTIQAFKLDGTFAGTVSDTNGNAIANPGLWGIGFRSSTATGFDPNALYFVAGINNEADGLFGEIAPVPEPATFGFLAVGLALMTLCLRYRTRPIMKGHVFSQPEASRVDF